jgi:TolB-like protein/class 3 adenylate cyclase/Tfp pilus assembly protein PilF
MPAQDEHRQLAAIMFTDMVGYSALTQHNEALALQLLTEHQGLVRPIFATHGGREIKTMGDGFLVEFTSALQAARCAIAIQTAMAQRNASEAPDRRVQVRIGLHLGDVEVRDGDVFGDGVNIAARIEPLAEAGGICISRSVYDQIQNKIDLPLVPIGKPELKNIAVPIDVYRVVLPWEQGDTRATRSRRSRWPLIALLMALAVVGGLSWWLYRQHPAPSLPSAAAPAERKSIAVLPFTNMSPDKAEEYLSDGMTEEIIGALSKVSRLQVAARTSSFAFKGKSEDIRKIGEQLNVKTVLEGSVTKVGDKLRVAAQLINVADGYHLWSETYDREMQDIFTIRSDVAQRVTDALRVTLQAGERRRLEKNPTDDLEAYNLYLRGRYAWSRSSEAGAKQAIDYFNQAIARDPTFALAYAGLADAYWEISDWYLPPHDAMPKARAAAQRALEIDPNLAEAHTALGVVANQYDWDWSGAEREFQRAIELNPESAEAHQAYGLLLVFLGRFEQSTAELERAQQLDPLSAWITWDLGWPFYLTRQYERDLEQIFKAIEIDPNFSPAYVGLGMVYAAKGEFADAITQLQKGRALQDAPWVASNLGYVYARAGQRTEAEQVLSELKQLSQRRYVEPAFIAFIYIGLNGREQAFEWLEKAYDARSYFLMFLKTDPQFDSLRSDPRFVVLLKKVGLDK